MPSKKQYGRNHDGNQNGSDQDPPGGRNALQKVAYPIEAWNKFSIRQAPRQVVTTKKKPGHIINSGPPEFDQLFLTLNPVAHQPNRVL